MRAVAVLVLAATSLASDPPRDQAYVVAPDAAEAAVALRVVTLDGDPVDLAYVFVPVGRTGEAGNVALGLEVHGVSPTIAVAMRAAEEGDD